jgi:hypothetical protein
MAALVGSLSFATTLHAAGDSTYQFDAMGNPLSYHAPSYESRLQSPPVEKWQSAAGERPARPIYAQGQPYQITANEPSRRYTKSGKRASMRWNAEGRIASLHSRLNITYAQEPMWNDVAQIMRENERTMNRLIGERHRDPGSMSAIDDLQSYERVALAHAEGLQRLIPAFQVLYNEMSQNQQNIADQAFNRYEGHRGMKGRRS